MEKNLKQTRAWIRFTVMIKDHTTAAGCALVEGENVMG